MNENNPIVPPVIPPFMHPEFQKAFLSKDQWRLISDCLVDQISRLKEWQKYGYEKDVDLLDDILRRIHTLTKLNNGL